MNGYVEMRMTELRQRNEELADAASATRLAQQAASGRTVGRPTLRVRFEAALAAWKQPGSRAA